MSQTLRLYTWEMESGKAGSRTIRHCSARLLHPRCMSIFDLYAARHEHQPCSAEQGHRLRTNVQRSLHRIALKSAIGASVLAMILASQ